MKNGYFVSVLVVISLLLVLGSPGNLVAWAQEPTEEPTPVSTEEPTVEPTEEPTVEPTEEPTVEPTEEPTVEPTEEPTVEPTLTTSDATGGVKAQVLGQTWTTGFGVQNLDEASSATVLVEYKDQSGNTYDRTLAPIPVRSGLTIYQGNDTTIASPFAGSAVISADTQLAAAVLKTSAVSASRASMGAYSGFSEGATEVYIPIIWHDYGWWTEFAVQNAGSATANIEIAFRAIGSTTTVMTKTSSIPAGESRYYDQADAEYDPLGANFFGMAMITSDQPIAAVVNQYHESATRGTYFTSTGIPASQGATTLYTPFVFKKNGAGKWMSGINVINVHDTNSTNVTVSYYGTGCNPCQESHSIEAGGAWNFYQANSPVPDGFFGSAVVQSSGGVPIIAFENELSPAGAPGGGDKGAAFNLFNASNATSRASVPILLKDSSYPGASNASWTPGVVVQNLGGTDTNVTLTLYDDDGTSHVLGTLLTPSGESANFYALLSGYGGFHGRAVVESDNAQPIAAAVNLLNYNIVGDALMLYNAVNY